MVGALAKPLGRQITWSRLDSDLSCGLYKEADTLFAGTYQDIDEWERGEEDVLNELTGLLAQDLGYNWGANLARRARSGAG